MKEPIKPKTTSRTSSGITGTAGKFINTVYKNIATAMVDPTKVIKNVLIDPTKVNRKSSSRANRTRSGNKAK